MQRLIFALVGFVAGVVAGGAAAVWYLEDDYAQQQKVMMSVHGNSRAAACQLPEAQRPKGINCKDMAP